MAKSSHVVPAIVTAITPSVNNKKGILISIRENSNLSISLLSCKKIIYFFLKSRAREIHFLQSDWFQEQAESIMPGALLIYFS